MKTVLASGIERHPALLRMLRASRLWRKYEMHRELFQAANRAYHTSCLVGTKREKKEFAKLALKHETLGAKYLTLAIARDRLSVKDKEGMKNAANG